MKSLSFAKGQLEKCGNAANFEQQMQNCPPSRTKVREFLANGSGLDAKTMKSPSFANGQQEIITNATILYRLMLDEYARPRAIAFVRKMLRQYAI